jgi:hypothetical protein
VIDHIGPVKQRPRRRPPFQSLTLAVIHEQLSGQAAAMDKEFALDKSS